MSDPLFDVAGQIVLVSGGSRGIGKGLAEGFVARGAQVVITGRDADVLEATAKEISTGEKPVVPVVCDVAEGAQVKSLVETIVEQFGRIDTLLNVAGVNQRQPVEDFTEEQFDFILNINLRGAFLVAQQVGRQMIAQGSGSQINIDSLNTWSPLTDVTPYAMSKFGVVGMTRGMAIEWGRHGVRVNSIAPGFILTDLTRKLWSQPHMQEWGFSNTPQGRLGEVEDLVGTAVFLASPASAFMTGQVLRVDGGITAGTSWPIREG